MAALIAALLAIASFFHSGAATVHQPAPNSTSGGQLSG